VFSVFLGITRGFLYPIFDIPLSSTLMAIIGVPSSAVYSLPSPHPMSCSYGISATEYCVIISLLTPTTKGYSVLSVIKFAFKQRFSSGMNSFTHLQSLNTLNSTKGSGYASGFTLSYQTVITLLFLVRTVRVNPPCFESLQAVNTLTKVE